MVAFARYMRRKKKLPLVGWRRRQRNVFERLISAVVLKLKGRQPTETELAVYESLLRMAGHILILAKSAYSLIHAFYGFIG